MHAVLLAGGKGTRLYPITRATPKCLLPLAGVPLIDRLLGQLRDSGVDNVTIVTGHLADPIRRHLGAGRGFGVRLHYLHERQPLDTAGCLAMFGQWDAPFLLVNADVVTDLSFGEFAQFHRAGDAVATVAVRRHQVRLEFGVLEADDDGLMQAYSEKPGVDFWIGLGIYCFSPRVCRFVLPGVPLSMPRLLTRLRAAGEVVRCFRTEANWFDIGRPESYRQAQQFCDSLPPSVPMRRAA